MEAARAKGVDDLFRVRYAIVEPNGRFSFITDDAGAEAGDDDDGHDPAL